MWRKLASQMENLPALEHPWVRQLRAATLANRPELYANLVRVNQLDDYLRVRVAEALQSRESLIDQGTPEDVADEEILDALLPTDPDIRVAEEYEIEGAAADEADALAAYLEIY